jgi:AcrR family transcriptional regulator
MPEPHKEAYHHGNLRRALITQSLDIIKEQGLESLTLRKAARRAGVSHAAPAHHFKNLKGLLAAIAQEGYGLLMAAMDEASKQAGLGGLNRLRALGAAYISFALAQPERFKVMFHNSLADKSGFPQLAAAAQGPFGLLLDSIAACQDKGLLAPGNPQDLALFAWSTVHGYACLALDGQVAGKGLQKGRNDLTGMVTGLIYQGLRK